jgi:hypothetical protein
MVVNNLITSSILTWLVMPLVSRFLSFWLYPAYRMGSFRKDAAGTLLVMAALVGMVGIFNLVHSR